METKKRGRPRKEANAAISANSARRVIGKPFQPGQSGNPSGRPKIPEEVIEMCRAASPRAIQELIAVFDDEQARPGDKIRASEAILNRAWGCPRQAVDLANEDGQPLKLIIEYASTKK